MDWIDRAIHSFMTGVKVGILVLIVLIAMGIHKEHAEINLKLDAIYLQQGAK